MKYGNVTEGIFLSRPNRFCAEVEIDGAKHTVHVKNTGRCRELLTVGSRVYLTASDNPDRKTKYDLIAVEKNDDGSARLVNIDSQAPNHAAEEWLRSGGLFPDGSRIRREVVCGDSRFDFCITESTRTSFLEVKGVTLEHDGIALFPDAPTERGVKHIHELIRCAREGFGAYILFVIQMKGISVMKPNDAMHREFGDALRLAAESDVRILAADCIVTADSMVIDRQIPVDISRP